MQAKERIQWHLGENKRKGGHEMEERVVCAQRSEEGGWEDGLALVLELVPVVLGWLDLDWGA